MGCSLWSQKRVRHDLATKQQSYKKICKNPQSLSSRIPDTGKMDLASIYIIRSSYDGICVPNPGSEVIVQLVMGVIIQKKKMQNS